MIVVYLSPYSLRLSRKHKLIMFEKKVEYTIANQLLLLHINYQFENISFLSLLISDAKHYARNR